MVAMMERMIGRVGVTAGISGGSWDGATAVATVSSAAARAVSATDASVQRKRLEG